MKIIGIISILLISPAVLAGDDCLLSGIFKSDAVKTMADYSAHNAVSNAEAKRALNEMFGPGTFALCSDELSNGVDRILNN